MPQPKTAHGKLSDVARHLVIPDGVKTTSWPAVRDKCKDLGIEFDPWQDGAGRVILAKDAQGIYATSVAGAVLSVPRQVGKTFLIGAVAFALCLLHPGLTVIWTSHHLRTSNETFRAMQGMAQRRKIRPYVERVILGSGDEEVRFINGSRILFGARTRGFGVGFSGVDVLVFDEAQRLGEGSVDDLVPTTNQSKHPAGALLLYVGTPPRPTDDSEAFTNKRRNALNGTLEGGAYIEISADKGASPDDRKQWRKANPSYPHRTPEQSMLRLRANLGDESFLREGMGIWDERVLEPTLVSHDDWSACAVAEPPAEGIKSFGIKFSADGASVAVAGAMLEPDKNVHIELVGAYSGSMANGTRQLASWLAERWRDYASIVVDGPSHSGAFINALHDAGVNKRVLIVPTWPQVAAGNAMFLDAVVTGAMTHLAHEGQELLDESVLGATKKMHGDKGAWSWIGVDDDSDPLPVGAASLALYGARTSKRRPGGGSRGSRGSTNGREAVVL